MKLRQRLLAILITCIILFSPIQCFAATYNYSTYKDMGVMVVEINSGDTLTSNQATVRYYPGSITKLLTALTALDYMELDQEVTVTESALDLVEPYSSLADLEAGELLTFKQLLYAMLLPSGNDSAKVIAVACGKLILADPSANTQQSYQAFVAAMNRKADELGMSDSHFSNSDGYDDKDNYSTPRDIVTLGEAAIRNETIKSIVGTEYIFVHSNKMKHHWYSTNMFLYESFDDLDYFYKDGDNPYYDARILGLKTGYTDIGGRCFMFYGESEGMQIVGVVLNATDSSDTLWERCGSIIDFSFDSYTLVPLIDDTNRKYQIKISNHAVFSPSQLTLLALEDSLACVDTKLVDGLEVTLSYNEDIIELKNNGKIKLIDNVSEGTIVAQAVYTSGDSVVKTVDYIAGDHYEKASFLDYALYSFLILFAFILISNAIKDMQNNKKKRSTVNETKAHKRP